jgi:hypothetical protein
MRHARDRYGAAGAERPDASPAHLGVELLAELLRRKRQRRDNESKEQQPPLTSKKGHAHPPRNYGE